ncbi:MAG TPA: chemotaxis protein CheW [Candidatus Acidoferrales bacterium]|nr:chemotaxis protein CheW [Candidatus Acidoferrales bacterium]
MNANSQTNETIYQLVSFVVQNEEFGVDILRVQEIIRTVEITRVPKSPVFVEGVINLRGKIVPVIDLRTRFGIEKKTHDNETRIIVVELPDKVVGFLVDMVKEVIRVEKSVIEPPPELTTNINANYITGVAKLQDRLLILLDLDKVLSSDEQEHLADIGTEKAG